MTDAPQPAPAPATETPRKPRRSWKRRLAWVGAILLILLISLELFARFYLGLGDPPLYVSDPEIEYLNKPSSHARRFGNNVTFNEFSMRSGPVTRKKSDPNEFRVLVVGDSIVNGGFTDDSKLATTLLQIKLCEALKRPAFVGNISAGSWGPPNQLAYLKRFGFFDADVLVLVWNSIDYGDAPDYQPIVDVSPEYPSHPPLLALQEAYTRYRHRISFRSKAELPPLDPEPPIKNIVASQNAIREIIQLARSSGIKQILIVQWPESRELGTLEWPGHATILATSHELGIEPIQAANDLIESIKRGQNPYRDVLHPNDIGQRIIADVVFKRLMDDPTK